MIIPEQRFALPKGKIQVTIDLLDKIGIKWIAIGCNDSVQLAKVEEPLHRESSEQESVVPPDS